MTKYRETAGTDPAGREKALIKMPFCPKCKTEYLEGTQTCDVCGSPLVGSLQDSGAETPDGDGSPAFLISVDSGVEAEMLNARLVSSDIPCYMKPHDSHGILRVYMGPSNIGADVYVPAKLLEKARAAIGEAGADDGGQSGENGEETVQAPQDVPDDGGSVSKKTLGRILALLVLILILVAFFSLDALLDFLRKILGY